MKGERSGRELVGRLSGKTVGRSSTCPPAESAVTELEALTRLNHRWHRRKGQILGLISINQSCGSVASFHPSHKACYFTVWCHREKRKRKKEKGCCIAGGHLTCPSCRAVGTDHLSCLRYLRTAGAVRARARLTITRSANQSVAIVTVQAVLAGHPRGEV